MASNKTKQKNSDRLFYLLGLVWILFSGFIYRQIPEASTLSITWKTETEVDTAGFRLLRATRPENGEDTQTEEACANNPFPEECLKCGGIPKDSYEYITDQMIVSQGAADKGSSYAYKDRTVDPTQKYCYILEDIELTGISTQNEPPIIGKELSPLYRTMYWILTPFCFIVGVSLIISGYRKERVRGKA